MGASRPGLALNAADIPQLVRICRAVDGLLLALELAAPWARLMDIGEIAREIERNLDFLSTTLSNVAEITANLDNVRAAWSRAGETGDREALEKAARGMWCFASIRGT